MRAKARARRSQSHRAYLYINIVFHQRLSKSPRVQYATNDAATEYLKVLVLDPIHPMPLVDPAPREL